MILYNVALAFRQNSIVATFSCVMNGLTFASVGQTLWGHLNESYWAVLLYGNVYCTVKGGSDIDVGSDNSNEQILTSDEGLTLETSRL